MKQILIEKYIEPSDTVVFNGGSIQKYWFNRFEELDSLFDNPAIINVSIIPPILTFKQQKKETHYWYKKNRLHRDRNLPAIMIYNDDILTEQLWYKKGEFIKNKTTNIF